MQVVLVERMRVCESEAFTGQRLGASCSAWSGNAVPLLDFSGGLLGSLTQGDCCAGLEAAVWYHF